MSRQIILDVITSEPLIYYGADSFSLALDNEDIAGLYLIGDDVYMLVSGNIFDQCGDYVSADEVFYKHEDSEGQLQIFPLMFTPE